MKRRKRQWKGKSSLSPTKRTWAERPVQWLVFYTSQRSMAEKELLLEMWRIKKEIPVS